MEQSQPKTKEKGKTVSKKKAVKKGKATKADAPIIREWANVRHDFTDAEKLDLSSQHVKSLQRIGELDEQCKATVADLKAKAKTEKARCGELMNKLATGYEMQNREVRVSFNRKDGLKSLFIWAPGQPDHDQHVRDEAMTQADFERLPLDDAPPAPEPDKPLSKKAAAKAAKEAQEALEKNQVAPGEEQAAPENEQE